MKDEKRTGFFKKIFGQKSSCCSFDIEEIASTEEKHSDSKDAAASCCSTLNANVKKDECNKE
jgi:hypothetical protein